LNVTTSPGISFAAAGPPPVALSPGACFQAVVWERPSAASLPAEKSTKYVGVNGPGTAGVQENCGVTPAPPPPDPTAPPDPEVPPPPEAPPLPLPPTFPDPPPPSGCDPDEPPHAPTVATASAAATRPKRRTCAIDIAPALILSRPSLGGNPTENRRHCYFELTPPEGASDLTVIAEGPGFYLEESVSIPAQGDPDPICLNPPCPPII
jgi:hypothetical protein